MQATETTTSYAAGQMIRSALGRTENDEIATADMQQILASPQVTPDLAHAVATIAVERLHSLSSLAAENAVGSLSWTERESMRAVLAELGGHDGLVVASRVADRIGCTRSVIVNALSKLESGGALRSRSLGMKGTHIKVLNDQLLGVLGVT